MSGKRFNAATTPLAYFHSDEAADVTERPRLLVTPAPPANQPPVANDATFSVPENSANGTVVGTYAATDPDSGQTLAYAITAGNADGAFAMNAGTGAITVADGTKLDYETATSRALTVTATDNGSPPLSDPATVTVNVSDVAEAPPAPAGLAATAGAGNVTLTWSAVSGATGYRVYRGTTPGGQSATPIASDLTATTFTDTTARAGQAHYYIVKAFNAGGESAPSNEASATPTLAAPEYVDALAEGTTVTVSWSGVLGATAYKVYRATGTDPFDFAAAPLASGVTGTTYADAGLPVNSTYRYAVVATGAGPQSPASSSAAATTGSSATAPATPSGVWVGVFSGTELGVSWDDNAANETGIRVERSPDGVSNWTLVTTLGPDATSHLDGGLSPDTTYHYRVTAYNDTGTSAPSAAGSNRTLVPPPSAPTGVAATAISDSQIALSWALPSTPVTEVVVERQDRRYVDLSGDGVGFVMAPWREVTRLAAPATAFTDSGLTAGTSYAYRLYARNAGGSSFASATAQAITSLPAPSALAADASFAGGVNLSWADNSTTETDFAAEFTLASGAVVTGYAPANVSAWTFPYSAFQSAPGGYQSGTPVRTRVVAISRNGSPWDPLFPTSREVARSAASNEVTFTPGGTGATQPIYLTVLQQSVGLEDASPVAQVKVGIDTLYGNSSDVTVYLNGPGGYTTEGADYTAVPRSVVIPAGSIETTFTVTGLPDTLLEARTDPSYRDGEEAHFGLRAGPGYVLGSRYGRAMKVRDDETVVEVVADWDGNRDLAADGKLEMLRIGHWGTIYNFGTANAPLWGLDGYRADGSIRNNLGRWDANLNLQWDNFIDRDPDRFYVRVTDPKKNADPNARERISATIGTVHDITPQYNDDQTPITLEETSSNSGVFVSASQLLTTVELPFLPGDAPPPDPGHYQDDDFAVHDGFAGGGPVEDDQPGDRTHRTTIEGRVLVNYGTQSNEVPVFRKADGSNDERKLLEVRVRVFNEFLDQNGNGQHDGNELYNEI